ncbi:MAG TPA: NADH-quinone oxidoreductase subunit J [Polyangiaceae bacterium]|jgi:NADH-quinone oxidoreductase subunit J|nr:NADH-quinone oxidoreductase subunit J [Polyangiaceae bacterium]
MIFVGQLFFVVMAALSLGGALVTVAARNPIRSAVGLLVTIMGIAGLFLELHAQFMAAIQLIVYAGAVVVLFVFVVMLLGPDASKTPSGPPRGWAARAFGGAVMALLALVGGAFALGARQTATPFAPVAPEHGSVELVGKQMFTSTLVPFELTTALLIVAVVGAIAVARAHVDKKTKAPAAKFSPQKLFHGPLHPRDAGHPLPKEQLQ